MASIAGWAVPKARRIVVGYLIGSTVEIVVGFLTGTVLYLGWELGLFNEILSYFLGQQATFLERWALDALIDEIEHAIEEATHYAEDSQREREAYGRYLARAHPHNIYLFGSFSVADAVILGASAYKVGGSGIPDTVFQAAKGLLEVLD